MSMSQPMEEGGGEEQADHCSRDDDGGNIDFDDFFVGVPPSTDAVGTSAAAASTTAPDDRVTDNSMYDITSEGPHNQVGPPPSEHDIHRTTEDCQDVIEEGEHEQVSRRVENATPSSSVQEQLWACAPKDANMGQNNDSTGDCFDVEEQDEFGVFSGASATLAILTEDANVSRHDDGNHSDDNDSPMVDRTMIESARKQDTIGSTRDGLCASERVQGESSDRQVHRLADAGDAFGPMEAAASNVKSTSEENEMGDDQEPLKTETYDNDGDVALEATGAAAATTLSNLSDDGGGGIFGTNGSTAGTTPPTVPANSKSVATNQYDFEGLESTVASTGCAKTDDYASGEEHEHEFGDFDSKRSNDGAMTLEDDGKNDVSSSQIDVQQIDEKVDGHAHIMIDGEDSAWTDANSNTLGPHKSGESLPTADPRSPTAGVVTDVATQADQFGAFDSALNSHTPNDQLTDEDADFGDFGEYDCVPMNSTGKEGSNGSARSISDDDDDDDFGDFGGADETVADTVGDEGEVTIPAQHSAPRPHSVESGDPFLSHARSKFEQLFAKYSQQGPTGELDTDGDCIPDRPPQSLADILRSLREKVESTKRESIMSESVLKVFRNPRTSEAIAPRCIISDPAKGPYSHFSFPVGGFDSILAGQTASESDEFQLPVSQSNRIADASTFETEPVLTETVVALPPLSAAATTPTIADTTNTSIPDNSQNGPGRVDRFLSQISDLSFMLSPRLSLPARENDPQ